MLENEVRRVQVQKVVTSVVARGWGDDECGSYSSSRLREVAKHSLDLIGQSVAEWSNPASLEAP